MADPADPAPEPVTALLTSTVAAQPQTDRLVILAVVVGLVTIGVVGLAGVIWLAHDHVESSVLAIVVALVGPPIGALGALLASTRSAVPPA